MNQVFPNIFQKKFWEKCHRSHGTKKTKKHSLDSKIFINTDFNENIFFWKMHSATKTKDVALQARKNIQILQLAEKIEKNSEKLQENY